MDSPNILVIQADQHRADCIGAYGNSDIKTPHIDALAADGVRYANSFCPYPVCTPSRYSFVSGLYVRQHLGGSNHCTLPTGLPTFPKVLRQAGYTTKAVGKMHLTPTYADIGFDELLLAEQNGAGRYDDDYHRWLRDEGVGYFVDLVDQEREYRQHAPAEYWQHVGALVSDLDEAHHSTTWIAERALDEVKSWDGGGHLLMASFIKPHHPFDPPASWADRYDPAALALLPGYTPQPQRQAPRRNPAPPRHYGPCAGSGRRRAPASRPRTPRASLVLRRLDQFLRRRRVRVAAEVELVGPLGLAGRKQPVASRPSRALVADLDRVRCGQ